MNPFSAGLFEGEEVFLLDYFDQYTVRQLFANGGKGCGNNTISFGNT